MEKFLNKKRILISTDVSSRGIDVKNVYCVIHYHTPWDIDTFVHRSGRTARAGYSGKTILITDSHDHKRFVKYSKEIGGSMMIDCLPS